jgi:eukaryotic-like serine/threonine-protein kinase
MPDRQIHTPGDDLIGRVLDGRYRLVQRVATGGMGRVYLAEQQLLNRKVAVKVLSVSPGNSDTSGFEQRFFREAKQISRLTHPNTVRIYDYGHTADGIYYIVMAYVEGRTLTALLRDEGWLEPLRAVRLLSQVCASLTEVHGLGLIHRDLKPDNILVTVLPDDREFVTLVDFGITKDVGADEFQTAAGEICGSPGYMSPEQIKQQSLTPQSDVYALGAVLFRMVTGQSLFKTPDVMTFLARHVHDAPPTFAETNPKVTAPPLLEWVARTCLAKDPAERFSTARELSFALQICEVALLGMVPPFQPGLHEGRMLVPPEVANQAHDTLTLTGPSMHPRPRRILDLPWQGPTRRGKLIALAILVIAPFAMVVTASAAAVIIALLAASPVPSPAPAPVEAAEPAPAPAPPPDPTQAPPDPGGEAPAPSPPAPAAPRGRADPVPERSERSAPAAEPEAPTPRDPPPAPEPASEGDWGTVEEDLVDPWAD